jgi:MFS family permease
MVLAFVIVGLATTSMYINAATTCVKYFGRRRYRGLALACPIMAFGLSGIWQSQVGSRVLYKRKLDGGRGVIDMFRLFIILAVILVCISWLRTLLLKVVDKEELIHETFDELERSGLVKDSELFRGVGYGAIGELSDEEAEEAKE